MKNMNKFLFTPVKHCTTEEYSTALNDFISIKTDQLCMHWIYLGGIIIVKKGWETNDSITNQTMGKQPCHSLT